MSNFGSNVIAKTAAGLLLGLAILSCPILILGCQPEPEQPSAAQEVSSVADSVEPATADSKGFGYTAEGLLFAGSPDAPLTVYEVFNANCPGCAKHHSGTLPQLMAEYVETGRLRYVMVDLPLSRDWGEEAHFAAHCVGLQLGPEAQWRYWQDFYDGLARWLRVGTAFTDEIALAAGATEAALHSCMRDKAPDKVFALQAFAEERLLSARWSTPFFRLEDGQGRRLDTLNGSPSLDAWRQELDRYLQ